MTIRCCRRCLLPEIALGVQLDDTDLCEICQTTPTAEELQKVRHQLLQETEAIISAHRSDKKYECIVAFSGGKDSSYTLKLLVEKYALRCLAITVDNGFLAGSTLDNCRAICSGLSVDHVLFTPNRRFMENMYRTSAVNEEVHAKAALRRASSICNSCISLINAHMIQKAIEMGVPLIAGGYIGGQLPRDVSAVSIRPSVQAKLRDPMLRRFVQFFGPEAQSYFDYRSVSGAQNREITIINPMLGLDVREEEILSSLTAFGWTRPRDAGVTSTNCRLNDFGVYLHQGRHGIHPYAFEIAEQLRHGLLSRDEAEAKLLAIPTQKSVAWIAKRLRVE